ncbi:FAD-dependent oxidoreductase [Gammaproteobacteria bacterium]|nr:FAD-dependent oxidoreductase [Gammaproteobacteria bacterium]
MERDYDVVVVGSGAAGLSAAISAADSGARVLICESEQMVGGSSRLSGGHFYAAGTSVQEKAGTCGDSADDMYEHYMTLNQWIVDPRVVRKYCDLSGPTFEWLLGLGVEFRLEGVYPSGVSSTPRGHQPTGGGQEVINVLEGHRSHKEIDIVLNARVTELIVDSENRIKGVSIGEDNAVCGAVIIATGGFGANEELLQSLYPKSQAVGDWSWYIGAKGSRGDGLLLGEAVGASIDGRDRGLLLVTPGFSRDLEVLLPSWLILVNKEGRRFASESSPYTVLGGLIESQGGSVHAVFDETARVNAKPNSSSQAYWVSEILEKKAKEGFIKRANTLDRLAEEIGVKPNAFKGTIENYNKDADLGRDSRFFKEGELTKIITPPFYGVEVKPAIICWTGAGLRIDETANVIDRSEKPIPGLFAAGETVGNLHGDRYIGGGGSFGPAIVFGKLAGEEAASFAASRND